MSTFEGIPENEQTAEVQFDTGHVIQVSREVLADSWDMRSIIEHAYRRWMEPWTEPDHPRWPTFVPLPRLAAVAAAVEVRRTRARDAWAVLWGRERIWTEEDEWDC